MLVIAALIVTNLWILRSFLPAVIWATTLVIATWPIKTSFGAAAPTGVRVGADYVMPTMR